MKKASVFAATLLLSAGMAIAQSNSSASGEALFKQQCAGCHGTDGKGQTSIGKTLKLKELSSADVQSQSDSQLMDAIAKGKGKMPAYAGKLSHDQIQSLVAYIRELKK